MADTDSAFTAEQQNYLQGFALGDDVARKVQGLPVLSNSAGGANGANAATVTLGPAAGGSTTPAGPDRLQWEAQDRQVAAGGKLCPEELAKRNKNPLDRWDDICGLAERGEFPKGTDVLLQKYQGLFYVARHRTRTCAACGSRAARCVRGRCGASPTWPTTSPAVLPTSRREPICSSARSAPATRSA